MDPRDVLLVLLACLFGISFVRAVHPSGLARILLVCALFCGYAFTSLAWSAIQLEDKWCMAYSMGLFLASIVYAYGLIIWTPIERLYPFVYQSTLALAAISAIYTSDSLFTLGFRSAEYARLDTDMRFMRVGGPLFTGSTGYFILAPAFVYLVGYVVAHKLSIASFAALTSLLAALIGLGSRGTVALGVVLLFLAIVKGKVKGRLLVAMLAVCALSALLLAVAFSNADLGRTVRMVDDARSSIHAYSFDIIYSRDPSVTLFGSGYGSVWPWYRMDYFVSSKLRSATIDTAYQAIQGSTQLYHPHSLPLLFAVELGLVGAAFTVLLGYWVFRNLRWSEVSSEHQLWALGLAASTAALFFDLFLLYRPRQSVLWWMWLFVLIRLRKSPLRTRFVSIVKPGLISPNEVHR
ncbi:MAG: hypothetical protein IH602_21820 [Bryobacteraceae bacterium]|nr:hypothetical protein [Bryobacteraceae bacterium]